MSIAPLFLTAAETAARLGLTTKTLANWRSDPRGPGPAFNRFGNRIYYDEAELIAWQRRHVFTSTADYDSRLRPPAAPVPVRSSPAALNKPLPTANHRGRAQAAANAGKPTPSKNTSARRSASQNHQLKLRNNGFKKTTVWLSQAARAMLDALAETHGSQGAALEACLAKCCVEAAAEKRGARRTRRRAA